GAERAVRLIVRERSLQSRETYVLGRRSRRSCRRLLWLYGRSGALANIALVHLFAGSLFGNRTSPADLRRGACADKYASPNTRDAYDSANMKAAEGSRTPRPSGARCALEKRASVLECGCHLPLCRGTIFVVRLA